jgi:hypothetical protein
MLLKAFICNTLLTSNLSVAVLLQDVDEDEGLPGAWQPPKTVDPWEVHRCDSTCYNTFKLYLDGIVGDLIYDVKKQRPQGSAWMWLKVIAGSTASYGGGKTGRVAYMA